MVNRKKAKLLILEHFDSQENFASRLGYHPTKLSKQLRGHYPIIDSEKSMWVSLLGCRQEELFA